MSKIVRWFHGNFPSCNNLLSLSYINFPSIWLAVIENYSTIHKKGTLLNWLNPKNQVTWPTMGNIYDVQQEYSHFAYFIESLTSWWFDEILKQKYLTHFYYFITCYYYRFINTRGHYGLYGFIKNSLQQNEHTL